MQAAPHRALLATVLALCVAVAAAQDRGGSALRIELDIFSGRPNPEWTLTAAEAGELRALAAKLPLAAAAPPRFDGLGYRGIVARDPADPGWSLVAYRDTVRIDVAAGSEVRADPGRSVERWLLGTAGDAVDPALLGRIGP